MNKRTVQNYTDFELIRYARRSAHEYADRNQGNRHVSVPGGMRLAEFCEELCDRLETAMTVDQSDKDDNFTSLGYEERK